MVNLGDIRRQYTKGHLDEQTVAVDPISQFHVWFEEYRATEPSEPTIMTVATVDAEGFPWQRVVLLKAYDENGFVFYTNYESNKGQHMAHHSCASLHFFWMNVERQIQIQGNVEKVSREEAELYFHSRPRESQLGAWASKQSSPRASRAELEYAFAEVSTRYEGQEIPLPEHWGGYRVKPTRVEFWQGGEHRLHDRVEYKNIDGRWYTQRLDP